MAKIPKNQTILKKKVIKKLTKIAMRIKRINPPIPIVLESLILKEQLPLETTSMLKKLLWMITMTHPVPKRR
jgi:hypothetical protein